MQRKFSNRVLIAVLKFHKLAPDEVNEKARDYVRSASRSASVLSNASARTSKPSPDSVSSTIIV